MRRILATLSVALTLPVIAVSAPCNPINTIINGQPGAWVDWDCIYHRWKLTFATFIGFDCEEGTSNSCKYCYRFILANFTYPDGYPDTRIYEESGKTYCGEEHHRDDPSPWWISSTMVNCGQSVIIIFEMAQKQPGVPCEQQTKGWYQRQIINYNVPNCPDPDPCF